MKHLVIRFGNLDWKMWREVEPILFKFLKHNLKCSCYDPQECRELSKELCEELKDVVKSIKYPRYKLVSMVTIGQKDKQAITISS
jgi:thymidylate synthase ThyX